MIQLFNLLFNIKSGYGCTENKVDCNVLDGPCFVIQKENFSQYFDQLWRMYRWKILSGLSSPNTSQVNPLRIRFSRWNILKNRPLYSNLCFSSILNARRNNWVLCVTQIFYTDTFAVITALNLMINCMATDITYLRNCGAFSKTMWLHNLMEVTFSF